MTAASTQWKEVEPSDEAARVAELVKELVAVQRAISAQQGRGRALHRKQLLGLKASVEVFPNLPPHAAHGVFAQPRTLDALVRLSNGALRTQSDRTPDIRGFGLKVLGVEGPSALGSGTTSAQDFLLINQVAFSTRTGIEFLEFVVAAGRGNGALLGYLWRTHGLGVFRALKSIAGTVNRPFAGFANDEFNTVNPLKCGPYAMKLRLVPPSGQHVNPEARHSWAKDITERLRSGPLAYSLEAQFFVDETVTPIEESRTEWLAQNAAWSPLARVTLHQQDPASDEGKATQARVEELGFDPWCALEDHRPLGSVMRARKQAYHASQQGRRA